MEKLQTIEPLEDAVFDAGLVAAMEQRADYALPIWGLMVFELWRREFL